MRHIKYYGYFTDNHDCAMRQPASEEEEAAKIEFNSLRDLYMYGLALYDGEESVEKYKNMSLEELENANAALDIGFGAPFLYYAEDENYKVCFDIGLLKGDSYVPAMHLDGHPDEEEAFDGYLDIDVPHKVIKVFCPYDEDIFYED